MFITLFAYSGNQFTEKRMVDFRNNDSEYICLPLDRLIALKFGT